VQIEPPRQGESQVVVYHAVNSSLEGVVELRREVEPEAAAQHRPIGVGQHRGD
jgi:hypothetical protein